MATHNVENARELEALEKFTADWYEIEEEERKKEEEKKD